MRQGNIPEWTERGNIEVPACEPSTSHMILPA
jgi:hypothetical protein